MKSQVTSHLYFKVVGLAHPFEATGLAILVVTDFSVVPHIDDLQEENVLVGPLNVGILLDEVVIL